MRERDEAVAHPSPDILRHQLMKIPVERRDPAEKSGAVMRRVQRLERELFSQPML
jgi:hypothetical protein